MDSMVKIYLQRTTNEVSAAKLLFTVSNNIEKKKEFEIEEEMTFYSSAISHSYYAIFYAAKAILLTKGIKTEMPDVHKKTYESFKKEFVDTGILDVKLLEIYQRMVVRADELLEIFKDEKWKRGHFTYQTIPQANKEPAEQSIQNAMTFIKNIRLIIEKIHR
ncbi:HEPN domain-containing protein [Candidatus Woesearchaeota archaeon]|nr:HEPN domain-containing protein [Candidatus Woesearchaeota archaeon]